MVEPTSDREPGPEELVYEPVAPDKKKRRL